MPTWADVRIAGRVIDAEGKPVARAMVKGKAGGATLRFARTNAQGGYILSVPDSLFANGTAEISSIGFALFSQPLAEFAQMTEVRLKREVRELEEVTVRPRAIVGRGDTLTYNVDSFRTDADRSIADVIGHLPGMRVVGSTIYYNDKPINTFYVHDLDILGGRYSLASDNIRAADVQDVNVYENHQKIKALKDIEPSETAAVNIRLKKRSLLRPSGYLTGGIGKEAGGAAWLANGYMNLIAAGAQSYVQARANNFGIQYGYDAGTRIANPMDGILNIAAGTGAGMPTAKYILNRSVNAAATHGRKVGLDGKWTLHAGYTDQRTDFDAAPTTTYRLADGSEPIVVGQSGGVERKSRVINLSASYSHNSPRFYLIDGVNFSRYILTCRSRH